MLKIVPQTPSSLSHGLESPGAQNHQHYSSLVRNMTFSRAAAAILENRVCAGGGNGTLQADTSSRAQTKVLVSYTGNMQKYFGNCPALPYFDLFLSTMC